MRCFGGKLAGMARSAEGWDEFGEKPAGEVVSDGECEVEDGAAGARELDADRLG